MIAVRLVLALPLVLGSLAVARAQEPSPPPEPRPSPTPAQPSEPEQDPAPAAKPGFLGVSMAPAKLQPADEQAVVEVSAVVPGSPAESCGLQEGDLILALNDESLAAPPAEVLERFGARIRALGVGGRATFRVRRQATALRTELDGDAGDWEYQSGARGMRGILPDLERLLAEHPEQLVVVRAFAGTQELQLSATLVERPGMRSEPLPPNETLRPGLASRPLDHAASLAQQVIDRVEHAETPLSETQAGLLQRFEDDEGREDPYRLRTVRYLHRNPLRLGDATRELGRTLRQALGDADDADLPCSPTMLLFLAKDHLDADPVDPLPAVQPPPPGSSPEQHGNYARACADRARAYVERALADLSEAERQTLAANLPPLAEQFARHIYLHTDEDLERRERHREAIALAARVDRGALLEGLNALVPLTEPAYLERLRTDLHAAEEAGIGQDNGPGTRGRVLHLDGDLIIGGSGDNVYRSDEFAIVIDLDGADRYHTPVGGARPDRPVAFCLDLGGHDRYQSTAPQAQGAALLGVGLLVDLAGNDRYTSNQPFAQGAALCGAALLWDDAGNDLYRAPSYAQGAALCQGLGVLLDGGGADAVEAGLYAQGFAGPGALGALLARGGDDRYSALGQAPCSYGDAGVFRGMSQGASVGFRHQASGGIGVLLDEGGSDTYEAGNFSQGGGYYYGWGLLLDLGDADDVYEGSRYAQGFAAHSALGSCWDEGGDDHYRGWVGAQLSAAWDLSATVFLDDEGDDRYAAGPGFSIGASAHNGFALFCDAEGEDEYLVAPGRAGPNDYHGGDSISVFLDAGGQSDTYAAGGLSDGKAALRPQVGVCLDLDGELGALDPEVLEELLRGLTRKQQ